MISKIWIGVIQDVKLAHFVVQVQTQKIYEMNEFHEISV